jgi:hypothetical protein
MTEEGKDYLWYICSIAGIIALIGIGVLFLSGCAGVSEGWQREEYSVPGERVMGEVMRGQPRHDRGPWRQNWQRK